MRYKFRFDDNAILKNRRHFPIDGHYINRNESMCNFGFWQQQILSNIIDKHRIENTRGMRSSIPLREDLKASRIFLDFEVTRFYEV
jgi:hypothetical protein